jgi:ABC-type dipeptide/oligopeptide/nickel transport system permease subunit
VIDQRVVRVPWIVLTAAMLGILAVLALLAPDFVSTPVLANKYLLPWQAPPFGTDERGIPLLEYAAQGASIVLLPAIVAGAITALAATVAGLVRCAGMTWVDTGLQIAGELLGSLPRLVVVLVVALMLPPTWRHLMPIAVTWAILAAPGAMDEAAATAGRLGGARFVEALRAHGFSGARIHLYHVIWLNLRPVLARQAAEVGMQVVFLEIALSYLAVSRNEPSFTHPDSAYSWATLLYQGYTAALGQPLWHSLALGLALVAVVATLSRSVRVAARAR